MSSPRYPVPSRPPVYRRAPTKVSARGGFPLFQLVAAAFVVVALLLAFWLAALLLVNGFTGRAWWFLQLLLFWALAAYLALPRVHQLFTLLYLPDYFIGRTRTADGLLGDPINVALDGPADDLHAALVAAGWTRADDMSLRSAWGMVRAFVLRRSYPAAPVSGLHLFGRRQDFTYQQEVDGNPNQRHHVRFWQVPEGWLLPGGHEVGWLASATYDRAVGLSIFTGQVTHRIDEDIDIERDYLVDTIRYADPGSQVHLVKGFSTAYHHRNGGGDRVRTDGDLPVVEVAGAAERLGLASPRSRLVPARKRLTQHEVPPVTLLLTGVLTASRALLTVAAWFYHRAGGEAPTVLGTNLNALALTAVLALVAIALWWAIVARNRLAWVGLMLVACVDAVQQLLWVSSNRETGFSSLLAAGLAVLTVLAVSSGSVRDWVSRGRTDPQVTIPDATWRPHLPRN